MISLFNPIVSHANSASAVFGSFLARHPQNDIRAHTVELSGVPLSFSRPTFSGSPSAEPLTPRVSDAETSAPAFIFPPPSESVRSLPLEHAHEFVETPSSSLINLTESTSTLDARSSHPPPQSNLSILMARYSSRSPSYERAGEEEGDHQTTVVSPPAPTYQPQHGQESMSPSTPRPITSPRFTEYTPLLPHPPFQTTHHRSQKWVARSKSIITEALHVLPAVVLGLLLNVLDGISCTLFVFSNPLARLFHVISRWYDYFPCIGSIHGSWTDGGVNVLCFVSYLPSRARFQL